MVILVVGMIGSIHTSRWINQIADSGWKIIIFPSSFSFSKHKDLKGEVIYPYGVLRRAMLFMGISKYYELTIKMILRARKIDERAFLVSQLKQAIKRNSPDLIHSLETQHAGYLVLEAESDCTTSFPKWWHTNWGSDIYLFGRFEEHRIKIQQILKKSQFYSCESQRDVDLALKLGFKGKVFPVYPNSGGFDVNLIRKLNNVSERPSVRKIIMVKGYQGWAGRCLVAIRALGLAKDIISGYRIVIYSNPKSEDVVIAARLLEIEAGVKVEFLPINTDHETLLSFHSKARVSIGLSISDAISTSVLEAMSMGSFPIQSNTSTANEWFVDGVTGLLVPPEDPEKVEKAIRVALTIDNLVDSAAILNRENIIDRLEYNMIKKITMDSYHFIKEQISL